MQEEIDAKGGEQPASASTAATDVENQDDVTKDDAAKAAEAGDKNAEGDKPEAATEPDKDKAASDAAKLLAERKQQKVQERQERWNKLTREKNEAIRRADFLEQEVAKLRGGLKPPNPEEFDDQSELTAAKVNHTLDQREIKRLEGQSKESREQADEAKLEIFNAKADEARDKYTDFDDVVTRPAQLPMSQATQSLILDMEESAEVIYHLAKNPQEARRIDRLSEREKAFELGKVASRITQPPPRKITQAPAPVDSVGGKSSGGPGFDPAKASAEEFSERYRKMKEQERA
jgi:hypothetical protein